VEYSTYDLVTGEIQTHVETNSELPSDAVPEHIDHATQYAPAGAVQDRPDMLVMADKSDILADNIDFCTITGVLSSSLVDDGQNQVIADGLPIEFSTDIPGLHQIRITLFPYQEIVININAT
jgi:hypothetical protein